MCNRNDSIDTHAKLFELPAAMHQMNHCSGSLDCFMNCSIGVVAVKIGEANIHFVIFSEHCFVRLAGWLAGEGKYKLRGGK